MYLPFFEGVLRWSLFLCALLLLWCALLFVLSSFAIILTREEERVGCLTFVFRTSSYCKCSVTLSHGVMGWSAVCDCGIF